MRNPGSAPGIKYDELPLLPPGTDHTDKSLQIPNPIRDIREILGQIFRRLRALPDGHDSTPNSYSPIGDRAGVSRFRRLQKRNTQAELGLGIAIAILDATPCSTNVHAPDT